MVNISRHRIPVVVCAVALAALSAIAAQLSPIEDAARRSKELIREIESIEGCLGVRSAHSHDGAELIMAWFEDKAAVQRWFDSEYHQNILNRAGRDQGGSAGDLLPPDTGPILVIASVTRRLAPALPDASLFRNPGVGRSIQFAIEYYTPLPGGAYLGKPYAPPAASALVEGLVDVITDDER